MHPAPPETPDPTPRTQSGRRRPYHHDIFTPDEEKLLRASLQTARLAFGSWGNLADALGMRVNAVYRAGRGNARVTAALAVKLAKTLHVPFESLITPGVRAVKDPCPTCGRDGAA